ncbi:Polysaccharide monooxygenase Cel61a [Paramyrothecium foliicola]|nr:Polysaccharide monooxygenase Cel61a [Paramyrothecium foliicola]
MKYVASILGSAAAVAAHGIIETASIGGQNYEFYNPYQDPYMSPAPERISRTIPGNGPVEDVTSADIQCNGWTAGGVEGSKPAPLHAKVAAGSTVNLKWTLWPDSHVGPSLTYMAKCPTAGCADYMPGDDTVWFKIQESGREGTSNNWGATPLMKEGNSGVDYTIPECIESGFYLVRHELIALHAAYAYPGAQFYPGCHQIEVTGGGSTKPDDLVGFPGAYSPTDPGITYDAYNPKEYIIPGPKVFTCSGSGSGSGSNSGSNTAPAPVPTSAAPTPVAPTPSAAPSAPAPSAPATTPLPPVDDDEEDIPDDECPPEEDDEEEEPVEEIPDDECPPEEDEEEPIEETPEEDECEPEPANVIRRRRWDPRTLY